MSIVSRALLTRSAACVLLLGASSLTQACELWRDGRLDLWRTDCKLSVDFKERYIVSESVLVGVSRPLRIKLPDLRIDKFKYFVSGTQVSIDVDVVNDGLANAPATDVAVTVDFGNPLTGMQVGGTSAFTARIPALVPGATQRVFVGLVNVPNNMQDWDLAVVGTNDPQTPTSQVWGTVYESNETNNMFSHACRWYGPTPNVSLRPCN